MTHDEYAKIGSELVAAIFESAGQKSTVGAGCLLVALMDHGRTLHIASIFGEVVSRHHVTKE